MKQFLREAIHGKDVMVEGERATGKSTAIHLAILQLLGPVPPSPLPPTSPSPSIASPLDSNKLTVDILAKKEVKAVLLYPSRNACTTMCAELKRFVDHYDRTFPPSRGDSFDEFQ